MPCFVIDDYIIYFCICHCKIPFVISNIFLCLRITCYCTDCMYHNFMRYIFYLNILISLKRFSCTFFFLYSAGTFVVNNVLWFFQTIIVRRLYISEYFASTVTTKFLRRMRTIEMTFYGRMISNNIYIASIAIYT